MDDNLKKIKTMLLNTTKKMFNSEVIDGMETKTLSELYEELNRRREDDNDVRPIAEYFMNQKYFKDESGSYYSFESYNNKMIHYNMIEPSKYNDCDENEEGEEMDCWYKQKTVTYSEGCRKYLSSVNVLEKFNKLKPISSDEYNIVYFKVKCVNDIKEKISLKENKINEKIKTVKFLGTTLRLCDYTKNMTQEEYIKLANLIDEETHKDLKQYLEYLNGKYKDKYIYVQDRLTLHLYKIDSFKFVDQMIQLYANEEYAIGQNSIYKTIYCDAFHHIDLIIDVVDENIIREIDDLIEFFFLNNIV